MNILLIGNGAREHTIAEALERSPQKPKLFSYMEANNPGIAKLSEQTQIGSYSDLEEIENFAKASRVEFAVVGPEDPLSKGVVDALEKIGIAAVGPKKELARLETSKSFTRLLTKKYDIPGTPQFKVFESLEGVMEFIEELDEVVVKPDGLTGGKGVMVQGDHFQTKEEAYKYADEILREHSSIVIEEKLVGEEFSLQCFTDGKSIFSCPPVQDHKRAYIDDKGPNTGGMGSYSTGSLLPFMTKEDLEEAKVITDRVRDAIFKECGELYKGVMYGGFICTKDGIKLIEYNARLGDPEAMNVLPIMKNDFVAICKAIIDGTLHKIAPDFEESSTVCKYAVPEGYPTNPVNGENIFLGEVPDNVRIYYASVDRKDDNLFMSSSRAVAFVGISQTLDQAQVIAEDGVCSAQGKIFHREDIGTSALVQKRIDHMKELRG
ncbi:MAG: phosphoribosylamine--glycine ligase [Nanoarchaeota archaeon]|nr:phosphoribosylamine--glycine ligase [Nanoarchaeota archaeon]